MSRAAAPDLLGGLKDSMLEAARAGLVSYRPTKLTLVEWSRENRNFRGKPFGFDGHEYLRELYERPFAGYNYCVLQKAAQMGASEYAMTWNLWCCDRYPRTKGIFFLPNDKLVQDFSHDRIGPIIRQSQHLSKIVGLEEGVENVFLKNIGHSTLYMRGMFVKSAVKSVDADRLTFDELDEAKPRHKQQALERISHSRYGWVLELSTPTLPGYGIDKEWASTDMRYWHLACRCPEGVILEDTFPECVGSRRGEFFLRCPVCGKEGLDPCEPAVVGEYRGWIPKAPEAEKRGYHLTQLFSTVIPLRKIWALWESGRDRDEFYNSKLGMPFAGDRMPLTLDVLRACCPEPYGYPEPKRETPAERIFIGADQGLTLHIVVTKEIEAGKRKVIWLERAAGADPFQRLADLIRKLKPTCCVVDGNPNAINARALAAAHRHTYVCFYNDNSKERASWDREKRKVIAHRTDCIDEMAGDWKDQVYVAAAGHPETEVAFEHLKALAKVLDEDETSGVQRWKYIHNGDDHYAHGFTYEKIAHAYPWGRSHFDML